MNDDPLEYHHHVPSGIDVAIPQGMAACTAPYKVWFRNHDIHPFKRLIHHGLAHLMDGLLALLMGLEPQMSLASIHWVS